MMTLSKKCFYATFSMEMEREGKEKGAQFGHLLKYLWPNRN